MCHSSKRLSCKKKKKNLYCHIHLLHSCFTCHTHIHTHTPHHTIQGTPVDSLRSIRKEQLMVVACRVQSEYGTRMAARDNTDEWGCRECEGVWSEGVRNVKGVVREVEEEEWGGCEEGWGCAGGCEEWVCGRNLINTIICLSLYLPRSPQEKGLFRWFDFHFTQFSISSVPGTPEMLSTPLYAP